MNLWAFAANNWVDLDGVLLQRGVDLMALPIDRACNVIWAMAMEHRNDTERMQMRTQLEMPLPGDAATARDDFWAGAEDDGAAFLAAMKAGLPKG